MDSKQFDGLVRLIGSGQSRRRVLKTLTGGALGAIAASIGLGDASAARKRANGSVCSKHADCDSGACYPKDRTGRRTCGVNQCTQVVCKPLDDCHLTGSCEPTTGVCSNPPTPDGGYCRGNSGTCSQGTCNLFPTLSCSGDSQCESHCPDSVEQFCSCGTTIEGHPVCHHGDHGCAGHQCSINANCADLGVTATCISGYCSTPANYCTSSADCGVGWSCVILNGGCGGCDAFTGGKGICNSRCTS